jgi:hypothetical protein
MRMDSQRQAPAALPPGKRRGTCCTEGWVILRVVVDGGRKSRPPPGFDPGTVQSIARRYTDYVLRIPSFWSLVYSVSFI